MHFGRARRQGTDFLFRSALCFWCAIINSLDEGCLESLGISRRSPLVLAYVCERSTKRRLVSEAILARDSLAGHVPDWPYCRSTADTVWRGSVATSTV